jgi:hypothetical protein
MHCNIQSTCDSAFYSNFRNVGQLSFGDFEWVTITGGVGKSMKVSVTGRFFDYPWLQAMAVAQ